MSVSGYVLKKIREGKLEKYFILFFHFYFEMVKYAKMWSLFVIYVH